MKHFRALYIASLLKYKSDHWGQHATPKKSVRSSEIKIRKSYFAQDPKKGLARNLLMLPSNQVITHGDGES